MLGANPGGVETLEAYLDALASDAAVPGGGSAAALAGAMAAALTAMVARIAGRNPKNVASMAALDAIVSRADELRADLIGARSDDETAFKAVMTAQRMPQGTPEATLARRQALDDALARAAEEPLRATELSLNVLELAEKLAGLPANALSSDVGCAAELAAGALASSAYNVRVNHRYMRDASIVALQREALEEREAAAAALLATIRATLAQSPRG